MNTTTKIFLYERKEGIPDSFLINLFLTQEENYGPLFQNIPSAPFKGIVEFVDYPKEAQFMMLPHTFIRLHQGERGYLKEAEDLARRNNLKTIIFAYGDSHLDINFFNSIVFRTTKYKDTISDNEIIIPPFVEDLGKQFGINYIEKSNIPNIGFAGMTSLPTVKEEIKYKIKIFFSSLNELCLGRKEYERRGLYFRRKALKVLSESKVETHTLLTHERKSFSAAISTIQGSPNTVRREFVDLIKNSHLPLVIRGNGNYSLRFFEVLSLGRVPLFIDTDTPLPLEDEIDYDSFMLRVNYKNIHKLNEIVVDFWENTSEEKFNEMQKKARCVFENSLRVDVFYKDFFDSVKTNY
jgi:hypothetical protein